MFASFFPSPKTFLWSAVAWFFITLAIWYGFADGWAAQFSLMREALPTVEGQRPPFLNPDKVWLYQYIVIVTALFCVFWFFKERNQWYWWAVCGSAVILLVSYFQVQVGVYINNWYGDFYDLLQLALSDQGTSTITAGEFYGKLFTLVYILIPNIIILVLFGFFTSHYVFRWRSALNEYYMSHWEQLRNVEGAAQRVQEDTMRFAEIMESMGSAFISSIMTLIAFLPLLWTLSEQVTELPLVGPVNGSLVFVAILSAMFGTVLLAAVGYRLPGLEFNNQKVEAAYRKELVYGEDDDNRATPPSVKELFGGVRKNYFKLYFNYLYFDVFRFAYLQGAVFIPLIALGPTLIAGVITFGVYQQINQAFSRVENAFQYLVNSWKTIIVLMSIHKRLKAFESRIDVRHDPEAKPALQV